MSSNYGAQKEGSLKAELIGEEINGRNITSTHDQGGNNVWGKKKKNITVSNQSLITSQMHFLNKPSPHPS